MKCIITSKGANDYITYVDKENKEVIVYRNRDNIAHIPLECYSAAYNGDTLAYTLKGNGTIFMTDLENKDTLEVATPYDRLVIQQLLRGFENLALVFADGRYIVYDYTNNKTVFDCGYINLDSIYDLSMKKYGIGLAAGSHKEYCDDEEWRFHAVSFRGNIATHRLDMELATKYSLYEDFYGRMICYDRSVREANFPIFYVYNDAYYAKAVSENYIVYVPGYEHHVVIVADIYGKIHRLLAYPADISNTSTFAYNEETDVVTIATKDGVIHRYYVNTVDNNLFAKMFKIYDQRRYFSGMLLCQEPVYPKVNNSSNCLKK